MPESQKQIFRCVQDERFAVGLENRPVGYGLPYPGSVSTLCNPQMGTPNRTPTTHASYHSGLSCLIH